MAEPGFWDRPEEAQKYVRELQDLKEKTEPWEGLEKELSDLAELVEMGEDDEIMAAELAVELEGFSKKLVALEFSVMLSRPEDVKSAIFTLQAGAGGTESCDWAEMLWRMYTRWCEGREYSVRVLSFTPGDEAGIKSLTALIEGRYVFGFLKAERGVHRLVRISPFDSNSRRHTSFASVDVVPEFEDDIDIDIDDNDLRIDTYRSSGAGGQHVNVTDSAVRITHIPTDIVVQCQNERSQHKNRAMAMKVLKSRLYQKELEDRQKELAEHYEDQKKIEWGSQIRSYVFHPYSMVKDHRTNLSVGNVKAVMDGDIDNFILEYLRMTCGD